LEVTKSGYDAMVKQVVIPMEKVVQIRSGKKIIKERNMMPGYILVEAVLNADIISAITQVPNVMHFLGKDNPEPMIKSQVNRILGKVDEMAEMGDALEIPYMVGEQIKVIDGPFNDFTGVIEEIMEDKKKLKVMVKIFGRRTPLELNYIQVEKIS
jgi:transcriptional antiterminator NusG